jgi:molybdenum cofactor biosynthesis enzyme
MDFFMILLFVILLAIYDMVRRVNRNILEQTEEIKKLHDNLKE